MVRSLKPHLGPSLYDLLAAPARDGATDEDVIDTRSLTRASSSDRDDEHVQVVLTAAPGAEPMVLDALTAYALHGATLTMVTAGSI